MNVVRLSEIAVNPVYKIESTVGTASRVKYKYWLASLLNKNVQN